MSDVLCYITETAQAQLSLMVGVACRCDKQFARKKQLSIFIKSSKIKCL